jgi:hypothetical protein
MSLLKQRPGYRIWNFGLASIAAASTLALASVACAQSSENVRGSVRSLTTAPRGEIDGAVLDNGTILHWPPHLEDNFKALAAVGEQVQATGVTETGPRGDTHFEVTRLTNQRTGAVAENDRRPPPRGRGPRERGRALVRGTETVEGVVRSFTTAPRGETDGALLDNGTALHWPPHLQTSFTNVLAVGDRVTATGQMETAPRGERQFEVQLVKNVRTGASAENDDRRPPRGPARGPRGPMPVGAQAGTTVQGTVRSLTTAPMGEVDGAILEDGTVLHWPPHLESQFQPLATVGERVTAIGQTETAPRGEVQFEVQTLKNDKTGASSDGVPAVTGDRASRLQALEQQLLQIQREIEQLKRP